MTRSDVKRLLVILGWLAILAAFLVSLLVRVNSYDYTLADRVFGGANENGYDPPLSEAEPQLLVPVILLVVIGVGLLVFGAGLTADSQRAPQVPPHGWQPPAWQAPPQQPWQGQSQAQHAPPTWQQPQQPPRDPWRPPPPPPV